MSRRVADEASLVALVARCRDGDGAAWATLVDLHARLVWAVLRKAGLSEADANDGFQNAWIVALEELHRLRDPARFAPWIARVARHQAMRIRRRYGIARKALPRVAREDVDEHVPDEELLRLERVHRVHSGLAKIGERCADLLRLLYMEEPRPAYESIAKQLGMRIGSIGPTRARCLAKLRERIGGDDDAQ